MTPAKLAAQWEAQAVTSKMFQTPGTYFAAFNKLDDMITKKEQKSRASSGGRKSFGRPAAKTPGNFNKGTLHKLKLEPGTGRKMYTPSPPNNKRTAMGAGLSQNDQAPRKVTTTSTVVKALSRTSYKMDVSSAVLASP